MTTLLIIGVVIGLIAFMVLISDTSQENKQKQQSVNNLNTVLSQIKVDNKFINKDKGNAITFNKDERSISFVYKNGNIDTIQYKDILQVEIMEDNESITQTVRKSQLAGTAIGGLLLGGTGAIIGGLSGKKKDTVTVNSIGIRIVVNDTSEPIKEYLFYDFPFPVNKASDKYKQPYKIVYEWFKLIEVLIHQADQEDKQVNSN